VKAVEDVSIDLFEGEALGLVGESGCGKSTLGLSILRIVRPPGSIVAGEMLYKSADILKMKEKEVLKLRGNNIAMVFQNPLTSLNPLMRLDRHFLETIKRHDPAIPKKEALKKAEDILDKLGIESNRLYEFPHQFSGGMRQRIMIGLGLIMDPDIIIADEPTTSLDVIVEAGFVDLLNDLRREFNLSIILITHNLGLVAEIVDRVAVMYGGKIMEVGTGHQIFHAPKHPYTEGLISCVPNIKLDQTTLTTMEGNPPDLVSPPKGCRFSPRCPKVMQICRDEAPGFTNFEEGHVAACWLHEQGAAT
jgi:oligopeptide/dipeptide ABC transporter ATP-binding protein